MHCTDGKSEFGRQVKYMVVNGCLRLGVNRSQKVGFASTIRPWNWDRCRLRALWVAVSTLFEQCGGNAETQLVELRIVDPVKAD